MAFFRSIDEPLTVVSPIDNGLRFPEIISELRNKYESDVKRFCELVSTSDSSAELLHRIRSKEISSQNRMPLLKIFRRCVSGVCDTEATKKIKKIPTKDLVDAFGHTFKPIKKLKVQFSELDESFLAALCVTIGEYDTRGHQGYILTGLFFDWFDDKFGDIFDIKGPRGAGRDVELSTFEPEFTGSCPCDFVIFKKGQNRVLAVGFARYDSTRGGAQSDDRTGGNVAKVYKIRDHSNENSRRIRILFLSDGPGLTHGDTWEEACQLDCSWDDNVRVATLKLLDQRVTETWINGE